MEKEERLIDLSEIDKLILHNGKRVCHSLYILIKTAQIHKQNNTAFQKALNSCYEAIRDFLKIVPSFNFNFTIDDVYVNSQRLKASYKELLIFLSTAEKFINKGIGSVTFDQEVTKESLKSMAIKLNIQTASGKMSFEEFLKLLPEAGLPGIFFEPYIEKTDGSILDELSEEKKEQAKLTFFSAIQVIKETINCIEENKALDLRSSKRVVQSLVDLILDDEVALLGVANIKNYDDYTLNHSINVAVYSIIMGNKLGFTRRMLGELGMAAFLHDIGKVYVPKNVLNKERKLTAKEWKLMKRHPIYGAKILLKLKGLNEMVNKCILSCFEHHIHYDKAGYPKVDRDYNLHLYSRIITIADVYDALTTSRVYRSKPFLPSDAINYMNAKSGTMFDPVIFKIFVNTIGIYPVGSLVLLNTGEKAIVYRPNQNPNEIDKPKVKIISSPDGKFYDGPLISLSAQKESGAKREIIKVLDPIKENVNIISFFT